MSGFTIGIEEEYFLVDAVTYEIANATSDCLFEAADLATAGSIKREFLQAQVEVITRPHASIADARAEMAEMRLELERSSNKRGLALLAAGTHPSARWIDANASPGRRYEKVMDSLQMIGRRNMLCGTHVHVELPDPDRRVDVMSRMLPYLPLLLALSTSSPFWQGQRTGLKGYRLAAYDELPRTGVPELLRTKAEYDAYVAALVGARAIPDASHIWWAIRPSLAHPTLELRALDCCTRLDDTLALAALYRALAHHLFHNPLHNGHIDPVGRAIANENQWRAKRYGATATFIVGGGASTAAELLDEVIELVAADADTLECLDEVLHCRQIVARGTSADEQIGVYDRHEHEGHCNALAHVARWLVETTADSARMCASPFFSASPQTHADSPTIA